MQKGIIIFEFDVDDITSILIDGEWEGTPETMNKLDLFCRLYPDGTLDDLELLVDIIYEGMGGTHSKTDPVYENLFNDLYWNLQSEFVFNQDDPRIIRAIEEDIKNGRIKS